MTAKAVRQADRWRSEVPTGFIDYWCKTTRQQFEFRLKVLPAKAYLEGWSKTRLAREEKACRKDLEGYAESAIDLLGELFNSPREFTSISSVRWIRDYIARWKALSDAERQRLVDTYVVIAAPKMYDATLAALAALGSEERKALEEDEAWQRGGSLAH